MNPDLDIELARRCHQADVAAAERRAALAVDRARRLDLRQFDVTIRVEIHVGRTPTATA